MIRHRGMSLKRTWIAAACAVFVLGAYCPAEVNAKEEEAVQSGVQEEGDAAGTPDGTQESMGLARIRLSVGDGQDTPVFKAGEKASLQINVQNSGNIDAQNVRIAPVIVDEASWPFEMDKLNYEQELGAIQAGQQTAAVWGADDGGLAVRNDVTGKAYKLVFRITYDDGKTEYETEKYVFVKTEAKEKPSDGSGSGGQGSNDQGETSQGNAGQGSGGQQQTGGSENDVPQPEVPVQELSGGGFTNSEPVISGGGSSEAGNGSVPRVIVTGFDTQPGEVRAGSDFKLVVHLKNTSDRTAVSNMVCDLQAAASGTEAAAEAPAFLPSSGSSSVFLESIPAGGTKDISIDLNARADLIQKPYSIAMNMKYEDSSAVQYEAQSSLAVPVKQEARFEFSEVQIAPDTVSVGEEANISCSLYNLGRVKMYNVKVRIEGEMIEAAEQFIGNLDAGGTGSVDSIITAIKETADGEECRMVLSYEDDAGNVSTAEQKFPMTVMPEVPAGDVGMMAEDMPEESGVPVLPIIIVVILAAGGITAAVFLTRRRKKKIRDLEEEELFDEVERSAEDER